MGFKFSIQLDPVRVEFDAGSIAEGAAILAGEAMSLEKLFAQTAAMVMGETETTVTEGAAPAKRGRKPKGDAAPVTATAPPPAPIPGAPLNTTETKPGVPDFLARTPAAPPAPPAAPPPPAPPAPPSAPSFVLGGKVADELKRRATGATDGGKSLADWLAAYHVVAAGATFDEAISVVQFTTDDKIKLVADALQVA